jgi:hypothetical protein
MRFYKKFPSILVIMASCVLFAAFIPIVLPVSADEDNTPDLWLGIAPVQHHVDLAPGSIVEGEFTVQNLGRKDFDATLSVAPYSIENNDYDNIKPVSEENKYTQIARWVTLSAEKIHINAHSQAIVKYYIKVPTDVPSGGQYARINVQTFGEEGVSRDGVSLGQALGFTLYGRIDDGNTRIDATLLSHDVPSFYFSGPIKSTIAVENNGNVDVGTGFKFEVFNFFTGKEAYTYDITEFFTLPETKHVQSIPWADAPMLGLFNVKSTVTLLGEVYQKDVVVLILPLFIFIIVLIIAILGIVVLVMHIQRKRALRKASWEK